MDESQFITKNKNGNDIFKNAEKYSDSIDDLIKESLKTKGVVDTLSEDTNWHNKFARFGYFDPYNALDGCREYVFFTRPDLNLLGDDGISLAHSEAEDPTTWNLANSEYFTEMLARYPYLLQQWTCTKGPFMNMITNAARSTLELPGVTSKDVETAANIYGSKMTYRGTSWSSDEQFDFNLEFQDNKYLEMYHLFKIYDEYERLKNIGQITPKSKYRRNRIIHDQFTAFKMVVGADGRELIYWAKATGVFPTTFPRDSFGNMTDMLADNLKFNISFRAHFARDFSPSILMHFNALSLSMGGNKGSYSIADDMPLYMPEGKQGTDEKPGDWKWTIPDPPDGSATRNAKFGTNINGNWAVRPLVIKTPIAGNNSVINDSSHRPNYKYNLIWLDH